MITDMGAAIQVGYMRIPLATALNWVREYTDIQRNTTEADPYAYPAYDRYEQDANDPRRVTDADLLAPTLLNVPPTIRAFYGLQRIRETLQEGLANEDLAAPLADINDPRHVEAMVRPLYAVLDDPRTRPAGVRATTLSKVLHRKRPQSLVLHDRWVRACYVGEGKPVPAARDRSWGDYMVAVTIAIGEDIRHQAAGFEQLDAVTAKPGELSHVRLLDVLAWRSRGKPASAA